MALGILEDSKLDNVPGTTYVLDDDGSSVETPVPEESHLKYDKSGAVPIILVPQPSDDPNDPLNWPLWKRDLILVILSITSVICATTSSIMAANTVTIALNYTIDFTQAALLTGYHLCGVGVAGIIIVPTARVWGKRHLFLLGNLIIVISCIWAGLSKRNHTSLIWARIFQGVGLAPFEALVNAVVGDLFFVHERGKRMALSNVALFGGAFLTPVIAGKMTHTLGWEWTFYFIAIFSGVCLPFVYFFVPETAYKRAQHLNTDFAGDVDRRTARAAARETIEKEADADSAAGPSSAAVAANSDTAQRDVPRKVTFVESLALFNGRKTDESFWKLLLRPFPLFLHPSIAWACLIQGVIIGWTVFIGVVLAAIFLGPPLWFTEEQTGYLYTGAFIGSVVGLFLSGLFSDWSANLLIRANKGKYEPEFRIWLVLPQLVFSGIGLFGFGFASGNVSKYGWVIPDVFFMFVLIGMVMGAVASALYIVDAHREIAIESFTCLLVFKNMFSFLLTYFAYNWVVLGGAKRVFLIIGGIEVAVCLLSVPMYIFGKRNRSFFHRHDILKMLNLW
ncbi:MFS transporter [Trichophyton violaceum]|uniref:MFS transporter n=1 Tax=Trichophyton violaceum TaxID=34388 RepID=A0A178FCV8_TRIVO|nr:MFS transporter [Trichophyton violaceum]